MPVCIDEQDCILAMLALGLEQRYIQVQPKQGNIMKKTLTITFLILSSIIVLDSFNAGHALMIFLLAGIIPGTDIVVSAEDVLAATLLIFGLICGRGSWALALTFGGLFVSRHNTLRPQV